MLVRIVPDGPGAGPRRYGRPLVQEDKMKEWIARFLKDESGATAIEYGLIAAGISVAIIVAVNTIGTSLNTSFTSVSTQINTTH